MEKEEELKKSDDDKIIWEIQYYDAYAVYDIMLYGFNLIFL